MLKQRIAAAHHVSDRLFALEEAVDAAISAAAELNAAMPAARKIANLSAIVGQDAMSSAAQSLTTLVAARGQIVETHNKLDTVRSEIGLREGAFGGGMQKPGAPLLSVVESDAA
jgi:hypothetical protein